MTDPVLRIILIPHTSESRSYEIAYRRLRILRGLGIGLGVVLAFVVATWGYMAAQVSHMVDLEAQVATLEAERARLPALLRQLDELERQYASLRELFGSNGTASPSDLWLPPPASVGRSSTREETGAGVPDSWPLTERGFVTRGVLAEGGGAHPGLDIAIPSGSYVRAAGAGDVLDVGDDATYGLYVRIGHANGYETLYAHASATTVELGEAVRKNEVIALSGSTGRSTAPHLHFEIIQDGAAVDPLEMVHQP